MSFDPRFPPLLTADLPGVDGRIRASVEDFEVEEIPAYEPSGEGDFLYLWVEKRGMGAEYFTRQVARRLNLSSGDIGTAGMKDRHAVTRQMVSVPVAVEPLLPQLAGDGIEVLRVSRHTNKLKPGHLHGNRFRVVIRDVDPESTSRLPALLDRIRQNGLPNYYGTRRFGRDGETGRLGLDMLLGKNVKVRNPFLRKLALSAGQSYLFNLYLSRRLSDGLLRRVLPGDVMAKWPFGGMFVAQDVAVEQERFDRRETVTAGPMFGRKTFEAAGQAAEREATVLSDMELSLKSFDGFGKLVQGTRRHNVIYVDDLTAEASSEGIVCRFTLPAGSYATILLSELMHTEVAADDTPDE